jgi:hypothetical protein
MKFLVLAKSTKSFEEGKYPDEKVIMETMKLHEEMVKAGVLLDAGGLWPSSQGKRMRPEGQTYKITDGPFAETKELIGGYWMMQAKSMDEVVEWMKRFPIDEHRGEIEIRRLFDVGEVPLSEEVNAKWEGLEKRVKR